MKHTVHFGETPYTKGVKMRILIAIPCMENMSVWFTKALVNMLMNLTTNPIPQDGTQVDVKFEIGSLVYDSRNLICIEAITKQYDWIMWLDSDMTFPPDTIQRMLKVASEHNAQMVTGIYVKRTFPTSPVLYSDIREPAMKDGHMVKQITDYTDYPQSSVFPVAGCGMGCCLTSVPLVKSVWDTFGPAFSPLPWAGEDVAFCYRVNELNEPILCDSTISCGHIGSYSYTEALLKRGDS